MRIFITGISSGIGRALAIESVRSGHEVWGIARRKELLDELQNQLGPRLVVSVCDSTNYEETKRVALEMRVRNFIPDIVVLGAAIHPLDAKNNLNFSDAQLTLKTNLEAPLFWISEFLPDLLQKRQGLFIGISSTSAYRPSNGFVAYPAAKAGLSMGFRGLRLNFAKTGVRFSTIHFGPIATDMWQAKKSFLIPSANDAADFIISIFNKKSSSYFFPFLTTSLLRISNFLPDKVFGGFSSLLKRKLTSQSR